MSSGFLSGIGNPASLAILRLAILRNPLSPNPRSIGVSMSMGMPLVFINLSIFYRLRCIPHRYSDPNHRLKLNPVCRSGVVLFPYGRYIGDDDKYI